MRPAWLQKKLIEPEALARTADRLRSGGKTLATLNGSFDLLHAGHLFILHEAAKQADLLLVALNSDASIQRYKGISRPIISLQHRLEMVAAIEFVHFVTWFEEDDPRELLRQVRPDVHVNGAEYRGCCVEQETVEDLGARHYFVERIPTLATTRIVDKIRCG